MTEKTKGILFLWVSVLLYSSSNSIIDKLGQVGANYPIHGHNPISFCNVLFLGNLIAGIVFLIGYRKSWRTEEIKQVKIGEWSALALVSLGSTILGPICYFLAIMTTQVVNVILISTTEIAWALILGYFWLNEKPTKFTLAGTFLAVVGVIVTFILYTPDMSVDVKMAKANVGDGSLGQLIATVPKIGEIFAFLGAFFMMMGDILSNKFIHRLPKNMYSFFRTIIGALFFFIVATSLFGFRHFADLLSPFLWEWMLFYGGVILVLYVFTFASAVRKHVTPQQIAIANAFFPVSGVIFAYLIVGEIPGYAQIIGGIIILVGIAIGLYGNLRQPKPLTEHLIGFKGI